MKLGGDSRFTVQHSYTTFCRISALELYSHATEGTQEFGRTYSTAELIFDFHQLI